MRMFFPFVGPFGGELDDQEATEIPGDLRSRLDRHMRVSLEACLDQDLIEIEFVPAPILKDLTTENSKMISLDNNVLAPATVCWEGASES